MNAVEKVIELFKVTLTNVASTAQQIARTEPLMPTLFFIKDDATVEIVGWQTGNPPYEDEEAVREMVRRLNPRALVFVSETAITVLDDNLVPTGMEDGIVVAGFYKSRYSEGSDILMAKLWKLDGNREASEMSVDHIPGNLTRWIPEVFDR